MPPSKLYKFAAATVMTTVAAATVVTFSTTDEADSSPVAAFLPGIPGNDAAPTAGPNDETPSATPLTADDLTKVQAPPPSPEPTAGPSRSSARGADTSTSSSKPKPRKPSPSPSPSPSDNPLGDLLSGFLGG